MKIAHSILVVDDHPIFLKGLTDVLQTELPDSNIKAFTSSVDALESIKFQKHDIAILDLDMPVMNGVVLAAALKEQIPELKIIMLTMHKEPDIIRSVLAKGINGYVFKDDAVIELVAAIEKVSAGEQYISDPSLLQADDESSELLQTLTKTEWLVLRCISEEKSSKEIADELSVSVKTIENHRNNISRKLQLKGSNSLLKFALGKKLFL